MESQHIYKLIYYLLLVTLIFQFILNNKDILIRVILLIIIHDLFLLLIDMHMLNDLYYQLIHNEVLNLMYLNLLIISINLNLRDLHKCNTSNKHNVDLYL